MPPEPAPRAVGLVAREVGLAEDEWIPYGRTKAKIPLAALQARRARPNGKLVVVSSITPTPAGEGKTTITIGLGQALWRGGAPGGGAPPPPPPPPPPAPRGPRQPPLSRQRPRDRPAPGALAPGDGHERPGPPPDRPGPGGPSPGVSPGRRVPHHGGLGGHGAPLPRRGPRRPQGAARAGARRLHVRRQGGPGPRARRHPR